MSPRPFLALLLAIPCLACDGQIVQGLSVGQVEEGLTGCHGHASASIPASGYYYLTTFGNGSSDDGVMSCGSYTQHGSWYYAASRQRYGCGARIQIEANGKCVVAQTDDYGPDECVEKAVGAPIIDASPLVAHHLFGTYGAGWSDRRRIYVAEVANTTPLGPCDGSPPAPTPTPSGSSCHSATLAMDVPAGTCVQSVSDGVWHKCADGSWVDGHSGCSASYGWCESAALGRSVAPRACIQSPTDHVWYQCGLSGWEGPVSNGAGPIGDCSVEYPL
jgi:hypothetical protein